MIATVTWSPSLARTIRNRQYSDRLRGPRVGVMIHTGLQGRRLHRNDADLTNHGNLALADCRVSGHAACLRCSHRKREQFPASGALPVVDPAPHREQQRIERRGTPPRLPVRWEVVGPTGLEPVTSWLSRGLGRQLESGWKVAVQR